MSIMYCTVADRVYILHQRMEVADKKREGNYEYHEVCEVGLMVLYAVYVASSRFSVVAVDTFCQERYEQEEIWARKSEQKGEKRWWKHFRGQMS